MSLKFTCISGDFKLFLESIEAVTPECRLIVSSTGIEASAVDAANILMNLSKFTVPVTMDEDSAEQREIGIDVARLRPILNTIQGINIHVEIEKKSKITITNEAGFSYSATLISTDTLRKQPNVPTLTPATLFKDGNKRVGPTFKDASVIGPEVTVTTNGTVVKISAKGDTDDVNRELTAEDNIVPVKETKETVSSTFNYKIISDVIRVLDKFPPAIIGIGDNFPLCIDTQNHDASITVRYYAAPRIPQEGA